MAQIITSAESNIIFSNTYGTGVTASYLNCIVAAEQDIESLWTAPGVITINENFVGSARLNTGFWPATPFFVVNVLTPSWKAHSRPTNIALRQAGRGLAPCQRSNSTVNGGNFSLPEAYAQMLGLTSSNSAQSVTLNTSYGWNYGQDVINALVHEISEGAMGRMAVSAIKTAFGVRWTCFVSTPRVRTITPMAVTGRRLIFPTTMAPRCHPARTCHSITSTMAAAPM